MVASFFPLSILCKPIPTDVPAFRIWYRSIRSMSDPQLDIQKASYFFALHTSWPAVRKRSVFLQVCDQIQSSMHQIFTQMH